METKNETASIAVHVPADNLDVYTEGKLKSVDGQKSGNVAFFPSCALFL